jgi:hypothetical protein
LHTIGARCVAGARLPLDRRRTGVAEDETPWGHQVDLAVVWIFAEVLVGGLALGALLILIGPRDDEAAALYRREPRRAWAWFRDRLGAFRMSSKPDPGARQ